MRGFIAEALGELAKKLLFLSYSIYGKTSFILLQTVEEKKPKDEYKTKAKLCCGVAGKPIAIAQSLSSYMIGQEPFAATIFAAIAIYSIEGGVTPEGMKIEKIVKPDDEELMKTLKNLKPKADISQKQGTVN